MKITKVEPIVLRLPSRELREFKDGNEEALLVRIETDEGIDGIGEIDAPPVAASYLIRAPPAVTWWRGFEELLLGENPLEVGYLWEKMYRESGMYGRRGLITNIISGLDIALWDIAGKHYDQPVYRLLGGGGKGTATPYLSINPFASTEDEVRQKCRKLVKNSNYRAVKFHNHPIGVDDKRALNFVRVAREELGDDIEIMLDAANHYFEAKQAIRFAKSIEPFNIYFLEAPLLPDNLDGYAKLSGSTSIRIAAGEEQTTRFMYADLMDRGKVDVVQPDATWTGGLTECRRVGQMAYDRGILCVPHCYKSNIGLAANLHLSASLQNSPFVESPISTLPLRRDLTNEKLLPAEEGTIRLSDRPGLGVSLNKKIVERYRYQK